MIVQLVISCLTAGISGGIATVIVCSCIENFGGIVGGVIGSVPTTIVASVVGLYFTVPLKQLMFALRIVPIGMLLTLIPLIVWRFFPQRLPYSFTSKQKVSLMVTLSLILWLLLAYGTSQLLYMTLIQSYTFDIISYVSLGIYVVIATLQAFIPKLPLGGIGEEPIHFAHHIIRFFLGVFTTVGGILFSSYDDEIGGLALAFPAVVLTSLCSLWLTQGEYVSTTAVSPLMLGYSTNSIFAILFGNFMPLIQNEIGEFGGFFLCLLAVWFICVYGFSLPVVFLLRKKEMASEAAVGKIAWDPEEDTHLLDDGSQSSPSPGFK